MPTFKKNIILGSTVPLVKSDDISPNAILTEHIKNYVVTKDKLAKGLSDEIINTATDKAVEAINTELASYLKADDANSTYQPRIQGINFENWKENSYSLGVKMTLATDRYGHGIEAFIPDVGYPTSNIEYGLLSKSDYAKFGKAMQFIVSQVKDANSALSSGMYPTISTNGPVENETFLVQCFRTTTALNNQYFCTQFAYGTSDNVVGKVYTRYIITTSGTHQRSPWVLLGSNGSIEPQGYSITYNVNGHGSTPDKVLNVTKLPSTLPVLSASGYVFDGWYTDAQFSTKAVAGSSISSNITLYAKWTKAYSVTYVTNGHGTTPSSLVNVTKLPSPLPSISATGYAFEGWYTDAALTTKAVAGSTISSDITLYAKWVVAYSVTYINNGHGSTPSKLSNVTKLPSSLPTLSASGYTFGGWYTDSGLTTKAVAGSVLTSNVTLYAKWTEVPKLYMYTGNTATTPTESEILQGTKYDYGTTKKFSTPIMELRSIWVCLPKTVTLVSMRNTSFSEFIYDTSTEVNYMNSKAITINEVQYILYYLTTIPSKCPYETIVK